MTQLTAYPLSTMPAAAVWPRLTPLWLADVNHAPPARRCSERRRAQTIVAVLLVAGIIADLGGIGSAYQFVAWSLHRSGIACTLRGCAGDGRCRACPKIGVVIMQTTIVKPKSERPETEEDRCGTPGREIFYGFRGWKTEQGEFVQFLSVICDSCNDLLRLCQVVGEIDDTAIVSVRESVSPFIEIVVTIDDRRDVGPILAIR